MRTLPFCALLLCLTTAAAHAAPVALPTANLPLVAADDTAPAEDGTGAPGSDNAGTGSSASTASPS